MVTQRELKTIARKLFKEMLTDALDRHAGSEEVATQISLVARRILGNNRPLDDNDREYYALCDLLARKAVKYVQRYASSGY